MYQTNCQKNSKKKQIKWLLLGNGSDDLGKGQRNFYLGISTLFPGWFILLFWWYLGKIYCYSCFFTQILPSKSNVYVLISWKMLVQVFQSLSSWMATWKSHQYGCSIIPRLRGYWSWFRWKKMISVTSKVLTLLFSLHIKRE